MWTTKTKQLFAKTTVGYPINIGDTLGISWDYGGIVIAWGYWREEEEDAILAVMTIMSKNERKRREANYFVYLWNLDRNKIAKEKIFVNIIEATEYYRDELGMEI